MKWVGLCLSIVSLLSMSVVTADAEARSRRSQSYESRSHHYGARRQGRQEQRSDRRSDRARDYYRPSRSDRAGSYGSRRVDNGRSARLERRRDDGYGSGWRRSARDRVTERREAGRAARLERRGNDGYSSGWSQTARDRLTERRQSGRPERLQRRSDDSYSSVWSRTARERLTERPEAGRAARLERRGDDSYRSGWSQSARERLSERREAGRNDRRWDDAYGRRRAVSERLTDRREAGGAARLEARSSRTSRQPQVYIDSRYVPRQSYGSVTAPPAASRMAPRATPVARYAPAPARSRSSVCGNYTGGQRTSCLQAEVRRGAAETARINRNNGRYDTAIRATCVSREIAGYVTSLGGLAKKVATKAGSRVIRREAGKEAAISYGGQVTGIPTGAFEVGARAGDSVAGNPNGCAPRAR